MWREYTLRNRQGGAVNIVRFVGDGDFGIVSNDATHKDGHDIFSEQEFLNAVHEIYPDGVPTQAPLCRTPEPAVLETVAEPVNLRLEALRLAVESFPEGSYPEGVTNRADHYLTWLTKEDA